MNVKETLVIGFLVSLILCFATDVITLYLGAILVDTTTVYLIPRGSRSITKNINWAVNFLICLLLFWELYSPD